MTYEDCMKLWEKHPDRRENPSFEDWRILIGEDLAEGASFSELVEIILAVQSHFGQKFYAQ